jgi:hypothetical protein
MASRGVYAMRQGWFRDPEDSLTTYRRQGALGILRQWGGEPEWTHSDHTYVEWGRERHLCDDRCKVTYPEWVTDEVIQAALTASDVIQTARGKYHQRAASRLRAARQ